MPRWVLRFMLWRVWRLALQRKTRNRNWITDNLSDNLLRERTQAEKCPIGYCGSCSGESGDSRSDAKHATATGFLIICLTNYYEITRPREPDGYSQRHKDFFRLHRNAVRKRNTATPGHPRPPVRPPDRSTRKLKLKPRNSRNFTQGQAIPDFT